MIECQFLSLRKQRQTLEAELAAVTQELEVLAESIVSQVVDSGRVGQPISVEVGTLKVTPIYPMAPNYTDAIVVLHN